MARKEKKEKKLLKKKEKKQEKKSFFLFKKKKTDNIEVLDEEKKTKPKKEKKEKNRYVFGPIEFSFDFISLVFVICVGLYFGGRSFYYYSLQSKHSKETADTVNGLVLNNNQLAKDTAEGLHQDEEGYFFRGNVQNNYVWFANRMFRIMRVNDDGTVKLVSNDLVSSFMWGEQEAYDNSNVRVWLTPVDEIDVSGVYYKTIPSPDRFIVETKYTYDKLEESKVEYGETEYQDKIVSLSLNDYITAGGKNSYLNNGKLYFILGYNQEDSNLYIEEDGSIVECSSLDGYGVRAVITLSKNVPVSQGSGTEKDPYVVDQGNDHNYVDSYVKLGDDIWKVYGEDEETIKMYLNGYITVDGNEVVRNYSGYGNKFDYYSDDNLGYYLMNDYINSLSYKDILIDNTYPYGEMSAETGYSYPNVYSNTYYGKMALLNIFDYVSNNELSDFFRCNTGAQMSTTQYAVLSNGLLEEAEVTDVKHIVPGVSISKSSIKKGSGRIDDPYVTE